MSCRNSTERVSGFQKNIIGLRNTLHVQHRSDVLKLQVTENEVLIKIEVSPVGRGLLGESMQLPLCETAQEQFDAFCVVPIVSKAQLFGGKLCAALDRQHLRDLFDVRLLLDNESFSEEIKKGLIFGLVSSNRPTFAMLDPHLQDQRIAFENQFEGMSDRDFSYDDYEVTRLELIHLIRNKITEDDKRFLISLNRLEPDWDIYDYQAYPSVKWKIINLETFREQNYAAWKTQLGKLEVILTR